MSEENGGKGNDICNYVISIDNLKCSFANTINNIIIVCNYIIDNKNNITIKTHNTIFDNLITNNEFEVNFYHNNIYIKNISTNSFIKYELTGISEFCNNIYTINCKLNLNIISKILILSSLIPILMLMYHAVNMIMFILFELYMLNFLKSIVLSIAPIGYVIMSIVLVRAVSIITIESFELHKINYFKFINNNCDNGEIYENKYL